MRSSPLPVSIHIIDDDSLLNVFYFYRPFLLGEDDDEDDRLVGGKGQWNCGRWWYKLAHVCRRWRNVVLGSAAYLGVSLVCTKGTPIADMLEHSPPLPLVIDYFLLNNDDITAEDEASMKREQSLLSSNMIASVVFASLCLLRVSRNSSRLWTRNIHFWNF